MAWLGVGLVLDLLMPPLLLLLMKTVLSLTPDSCRWDWA